MLIYNSLILYIYVIIITLGFLFLRMNDYVNIYRLIVFCQLFTCIVYYIHENVKHYIKYY